MMYEFSENDGAFETIRAVSACRADRPTKYHPLDHVFIDDGKLLAADGKRLAFCDFTGGKDGAYSVEESRGSLVLRIDTKVAPAPPILEVIEQAEKDVAKAPMCVSLKMDVPFTSFSADFYKQYDIFFPAAFFPFRTLPAGVKIRFQDFSNLPKKDRSASAFFNFGGYTVLVLGVILTGLVKSPLLKRS